jgi:hypothetical protein
MIKINVTGCKDCPFLNVETGIEAKDSLFLCGLSGWLDSEEEIIGSELKTPEWCPLDKMLIGRDITNTNVT